MSETTRNDGSASGTADDTAGGPAGGPADGSAADGPVHRRTRVGRRSRRPKWRWRWPVRLGVVAVVVVAGLVIADHVDLNEYVLTPGDAQAVDPLVTVPAGMGHKVHGAVLLTDVYVTQVTALSYLRWRLDGNAQLVPATTLLGPGTPATEMLTQGYLDMAQSQDAAKAAALTRLGYSVTERTAGTLIYGVQPGSPASRVLHVGQVVTAVGGTPTPDVCAFIGALAPLRPGTVVDLTVHQDRVTSDARQIPGAVVQRHVRLTSWPRSVQEPSTTTCPGNIPASHAYLGVQVETQKAFDYPFPVSIRTSTIGGPSAGLAMTLGIIDTLDGGHLTGGQRVAATGTIDPRGDVGDVGGVPQKTVAVEQAGATVFFVPSDEKSTAVAKATPSLHVYGVTSLGQVLSILHRLGGTVPPSHQVSAGAS